MTKIQFLTAACALSFCVAGTGAQAESHVVFEGASWTLSTDTPSVVTYEGREALYLNRASASPDDMEFGDGVLEYDFASYHPSGFVGLEWRAVGVGNAEQFYVRLHHSGEPDATQYMPVFNGLGAWQIHAGPNDATAVDLPAGVWTHVKIVAQGDQADIYVGDVDTPTLHVPLLRRTPASGGVELFATDRPGMDTGAYFSNLTVRPLAAGEGVVGSPIEVPSVPDTVITTWNVSDPFSESLVDGSTDLSNADLPELSWEPLDVESNGIANLAKSAVIGQNADTVLVKTTLTADEASVHMFAFGYSDRVRLYLNGELLFSANAGWRVRDHNFLGTVGRHDVVLLRLRAGENELIAAVSESFGGWGFTGAIEDQVGLTITP